MGGEDARRVDEQAALGKSVTLGLSPHVSGRGLPQRGERRG